MRATTRANLKNIMQKATECLTPFIGHVQKGRTRKWISGGLRRGAGVETDCKWIGEIFLR